MIKPIDIHEKAMEFSFLAKQAREMGDEDNAIANYENAAKYESEAADFYLEKRDLEPTRSILLRSAAFLNLKAGLIDKAEKYIYLGLINVTDNKIKEQLYNALVYCIANKSFDKNTISGSVDYINRLRGRSVIYTIESKEHKFGAAVTLENINNFTNNYLNSIQGYSKSKYKGYYAGLHPNIQYEEIDTSSFLKHAQPIVTNSGFGSFKISLATDTLVREGEPKELTKLKSNILQKYHNEIFSVNPTDDLISQYKNEFKPDEIEEIFSPLFNIKTSRNSYQISYFDKETFNKIPIEGYRKEQKEKLLPKKTIIPTDIGYIETSLTHTRETRQGTPSKKVILKEKLKTYTFDYKIDIIEPKNGEKIILNATIVLDAAFDSTKGFTIRYSKLNLETTAITIEEALDTFYGKFIRLIRDLKIKQILTGEQKKQWGIINDLINNPDKIN